MLSISNLICDHRSGSEQLRYSHVDHRLPSASTEAPRPVVVWALTQACNLRCAHCYASATPEAAPKELSFLEGAALLDDLRRFGVPAVLFSGGEPLVRPDVLDLIAYARFIDLPVILSTNGTLIDEAMADRLAGLSLKYIGISLDGAPERHDRLRGMKGAFAKSVAAIDHCRARGIKVGVRFTVHALNRADMDSIFDLCLEHQVQRLCVYHLAYAGRGVKMARLDLSSDETRQVVDQIVQRTRQCHQDRYPLEVLTVDNHADAAYLIMHLQQTDPERAAAVRERLEKTGGNRSGCNIAAIDPTGNVHYDQFSWHYNCGNIRDRPFSEIWSQPEDRRLAILRYRQTFLPHRCQQCEYLNVCNGNLRTRAEAATGNWLGVDPGCYLTEEEIGVKHRSKRSIREPVAPLRSAAPVWIRSRSSA